MEVGRAGGSILGTSEGSFGSRAIASTTHCCD